jgi:hypothetical protein
VDCLPEGFVLEAAGWGTGGQEWGSEETGTDEPVTVLAPTGDRERSPRVIVSTTGFAGYIEGFDGALPHVGAFTTTDDRPVDGHRARFRTFEDEETGQPTAELLVQRGEDVAVRVHATGASRDELVHISRATSAPADHRDPPEVGPLDGYRLVGSLSIDALLALYGTPQPYSDAVPGTDRARSLGWLKGDEAITVEALSPARADIEALGADVLPYSQNAAVDLFEIGGRPAAFVVDDSDDRRVASLVTTTTWGDLLVVHRASRRPIERAELVMLAGSARRTTDAAWSAVASSTDGGPGLGPDHGAIELARGREGDIEWLLQAAPGGGAAGRMDLSEEMSVDGCLKLSTGERACPSDSGSGPGYSEHRARPDTVPAGFPPYLVVSVTGRPASIRVTSGTTVLTAPAVPIPGTDQSAAVLFGEVSGFPQCERPGFRIELLDASGAAVGCVGGPP